MQLFPAQVNNQMISKKNSLKNDKSLKLSLNAFLKAQKYRAFFIKTKHTGVSDL